MNSILAKSRAIKKEADDLLTKYKIIEKLSDYGEVRFTGSYYLDLMMKKDIDISLVKDSLPVEVFSELGKKLIDSLNSPSVYYRNTRIKHVDKRPEDALYWGIETDGWFIDIWAMKKKVYSRSEKYIKEIEAELNDKMRLIILNLKSVLLESKRYGKEVGSRELYDAVLNHNVKTEKELSFYLNNLSTTNEYQ